MDLTIGIECEAFALSYVVIAGTRVTYEVVANATIKAPANSDRSHVASWAHTEMKEMFMRYEPIAVGLKKTELGSPARASSLDRAEVDGVVRLAAMQAGKPVEGWPWKSLSARLKTGNKDGTTSAFRADPNSTGVPKARYGALAAALVALDLIH